MDERISNLLITCSTLLKPEQNRYTSKAFLCKYRHRVAANDTRGVQSAPDFRAWAGRRSKRANVSQSGIADRESQEQNKED